MSVNCCQSGERFVSVLRTGSVLTSVASGEGAVEKNAFLAMVPDSQSMCSYQPIRKVRSNAQCFAIIKRPDKLPYKIARYTPAVVVVDSDRTLSLLLLSQFSFMAKKAMKMGVS